MIVINQIKFKQMSATKRTYLVASIILTIFTSLITGAFINPIVIPFILLFWLGMLAPMLID